MTLDSEFFIGNRKKLRELFSGTAPIVITGNSYIQKSGDQKYPFTQDSNFWYLTGINEPGFLLVMEPDHEYLISPKSNSVREVFEGTTDIEKIKSKSGISDIHENQDGWKQLKKRLKKVKHVATIQPSPSFIKEMIMYVNPARAYLVKKMREYNKDLNLIDIRTILSNMRSVKNSEEIDNIKASIAETKEVFDLINKIYSKSNYEKTIHAEVQKYLIENNLEFAYDPIIASGVNATTLHYSENSSKIDHSKFLLVDIGVSKNGYKSDITRTVVKEPTKRQQKIYEAVLNVQEFALGLLKPGLNFKDYEEETRKFMGEKLRELGLIKSIDDESMAKFFPHATSICWA